MPAYLDLHEAHDSTGSHADTLDRTPPALPQGLNPADVPTLGPALGSYFGDAAAARQAIDMALPMIEHAIRDRDVCGSGFLYIVVLDPGLTPADADFEEAILAEHAIGDTAQWDADYAAFARAKARLSWEYGCDSHDVQHRRAHRLREGDSLLWGGVCLDGIVVGVSGAFPWYDEAFAMAVAANLRAIAKHRRSQAVAAGRLVASPPQPITA